MLQKTAMEESGETLLLESLVNLGVPIPPGVSSVRELNPATIYALSSQAIGLIDHNTPSFPMSLPEDSDFMVERVNACTELASAFKKLGFVGDLSFHKFLYPSEEDLYKLVGFLVCKLSELADPRDKADDEKVLTGLGGLGLGTSPPESSILESDDHVSSEPNSTLVEQQRSSTTGQDLCESQNECGCSESKAQSQGAENLGKDDFWEQDVPQEQLTKQMVGESPKLQDLEEELQLLKAAEKMILDGEQPVQFHIEELGKQLEAKRHKLKELETEWDAIEKPLLDKKRNLKQSLLELHPEAYAKLTRFEEVEREIASVLADVKRREEEISKLTSDLETQPKLAPRRSHIERIIEITKNSRKQDADIQRILKDTREVQLESNTIQERLSRTYAVVDETIFREAKKDPVARQAYRLLANMHEKFELIAEKTLAADRSRRDVADYEAKLAAISDRSLDLGKLEADLDAIRKENELLEQRLRGKATST